MTFSAVAIAFMLACVAVGSRASSATRWFVAVSLASAMVLAQLALLLRS